MHGFVTAGDKFSVQLYTTVWDRFKILNPFVINMKKNFNVKY